MQHHKLQVYLQLRTALRHRRAMYQSSSGLDQKPHELLQRPRLRTDPAMLVNCWVKACFLAASLINASQMLTE